MEVFTTKLRRVGSSYGFLVPKRVVDRMAVHEGDNVEVALLPPAREQERALDAFIGLAPNLPPFERERKDRY